MFVSQKYSLTYHNWMEYMVKNLHKTQKEFTSSVDNTVIGY